MPTRRISLSLGPVKGQREGREGGREGGKRRISPSCNDAFRTPAKQARARERNEEYKRG